MLSERVLVYIC